MERRIRADDEDITALESIVLSEDALGERERERRGSEVSGGRGRSGEEENSSVSLRCSAAGERGVREGERRTL